MTEYNIRGTTFDGQAVDVTIDAPNRRAALAVIGRSYKSKLKSPFDIFTTSKASDEQLKAVYAILRLVDVGIARSFMDRYATLPEDR